MANVFARLPWAEDALTPIFDKCPHCGEAEGYYTKDTIRGYTRTAYSYDPARDPEGDACEARTQQFQGKVAYCVDCDAPLFRLKHPMRW